MDILNFISWIKGGRVVTSVDPSQTLIPVGLKDNRRDDSYLAGAITVEDLAAQIATPPAYKVYTALLSQQDDNPPVAIVLENTLEANLTWYYSTTGVYYAESYGTWKTNKTGIFVGPLPNESIGAYTQTSITTEDQLFLVVLKSDDTAVDNVLDLTLVEIRVYN